MDYRLLILPYALLLFRIITALIFFSSGQRHVMDVDARAKSIGLSKPATIALGIAEMIAAVMVAGGIFAWVGALIFICIMLGAIYKKIVVWHTKFYEEKGYGWHYDLLLLLGSLVILALDGGRLVLI